MVAANFRAAAEIRMLVLLDLSDGAAPCRDFLPAPERAWSSSAPASAASPPARSPTSITVVDRRNYNLFQPLLYQVATAALSPAGLAWPIRSLISRQMNVAVQMGRVVGIDRERREVVLRTAASASTGSCSRSAPGTPISAWTSGRWRCRAACSPRSCAGPTAHGGLTAGRGAAGRSGRTRGAAFRRPRGPRPRLRRAPDRRIPLRGSPPGPGTGAVGGISVDMLR